MLESTMISFDAPPLDGVRFPFMKVEGNAPGPHLFVMAGVHGCEYSPMEAARRFMRSLDAAHLSGTVSCIPLINVPAFQTRTPFVVPVDGKNPNRCFPGDPGGTFTDVLTYHVFHDHIANADYLIDMHCGDLVEALAPFTLYDRSQVEDRAHAMAVAYGLDYIVRLEPSEAPIAGTSSAAAAAAGIPAITPEIGGCGLLEEHAVVAHVNGATNVLKRLGMLPGEPKAPGKPPRGVERFVWMRSTAGGWWSAEVHVGEQVAAGQRLGAINDLLGGELEVIKAPESGTPLFLTTSPAVDEDGLLLGLGAGIHDL